ncbi:MAG: hypothetical protein ACRDT0_21325 [Pseudonocardiaceae bacterium]
MGPYLDRLIREERSGVAAIGVTQEFQRVFTGTTSHPEQDGGGVGHFSYAKADRRVTAYYFYVVDEVFGPVFIKVCAYFPYPIKICLLTELSGESSHFRGQMVVGVGTVPAHDRIRRTTAGSGCAGGGSAGFASDDRRSIPAIPAA